MSSRRITPVRAGLRHLALAATSAFALLPFLWMVSTSLKGPADIFQPASLVGLIAWDPSAAADNYRAVFVEAGMARFLLNGVVVCAGILILQILIAFPCAYALSKLHFPGREAVFGAVLVGLLVPGQALALPLFVLFHTFDLVDTYAGLILPHAISLFGVFLFRQLLKGVPDDYVHAARLDGMGEGGVLVRVMLPLAAPALLAFSAFSIASHWNDLLWPMIVVQSRELATPPLALLFFKTSDAGIDYGRLMAAATVVVAPLAILFFAAQRWFTAGLSGLGARS